MIGIFLAAFAIGGPITAALCGVGGIVYMFYLNFKLGPKLTLLAIPVAICVVLCVTLEDFLWMYAKYMLLYVVIAPVVTAIICHFWLEEGYKGIVIWVTAGVMVLTIGLLAGWMYIPRGFSTPDQVSKIQIQKMSESIQAVYTGSEDIENLLDALDRVEMRGSFKELAESKGSYRTYRLTLLDEQGEDVGTYYFFSRHYVAKSVGKHYVYYRWSEDSKFPYDQLVSMYNRAVGASQ